MHEEPEPLREAVGVFTSENNLQAAIDELLSSGFHRAELSLLAGEDAVNEKLGDSFARSSTLADNSAAPRTAYVSPEAIGDAQGGIVAGLSYADATIAAGAVVVSGGTDPGCRRCGDVGRGSKRRDRRYNGQVAW
jgi:hypothetical protein